MYIISVNNLDKAGRVNVNGLFGAEKVENVVLAVDVGIEQIEVVPVSADEKPAFGVIQKIDEKNRLVLPLWIRNELQGCKKICLVAEDDRRFLSPKTGSIIPWGE